ncbi:MAG TPA: LamG domain-containing protein, partial [Methylococcales bacterium]
FSQAEITTLYGHSPDTSVPAGNPVVWYNFNSDAVNETISNNSDSVYGNAIPVTPLTWTSNGKSGGAFEFNGKNGYLQTGNLDANQLTIAGWVKRGRVYATTNEGIVSGSSCGSWGFGIASNNTLFFSHMCSDTVVSTATILDKEWHYIAISYNGSKATFYIDGVNAGSPDYSPTFNSNGAPYRFGVAWLPNSEYFKGTLDDMAFYNRALSSQEITDLAGNLPDTTAPAGNPLLFYNFNSDAVNGVVSNYGHGYDALISGTPPTWISNGETGGAFEFNSVNNYLNINNLDANQLTISAWIQRDSLNLATDEDIIGSANCGGWELSIAPDNTLVLSNSCNNNRTST